MSRGPKRRITSDSPLWWLHENGVDLAPLTGQDTQALLAIAEAWNLFAFADDTGRAAVLAAVRSLLRAMQPKCRPLTKKLIARALDWSDVDRLWALVQPPLSAVALIRGDA